jgi:hypothetical protein
MEVKPQLWSFWKLVLRLTLWAAGAAQRCTGLPSMGAQSWRLR